MIVALPLLLLMLLTNSVWPLLIPAIALGIAWGLGARYRRQQLLFAADPIFQDLITTHQGKITVADLSLATGMSHKSAHWFLKHKATAYGAQVVEMENLGVAYHFLTAGAIDNIFEHSTPDTQIIDIPNA